MRIQESYQDRTQKIEIAMVPFFKKDLVVNRSCDALLSELSASTIISCDRMNYGKEGEFRGSVWHNGFRIALNTYYWNSF